MISLYSPAAARVMEKIRRDAKIEAMKKIVCCHCGKECAESAEDNGFGYEYGSQQGAHVQIDMVSDCCGESIKTVMGDGNE